MAKRQTTAFVRTMLDHLWEHRRIAGMAPARGSDRESFEIATPAGFTGHITHKLNGRLCGFIMYEGALLETEDRDGIMIAQMLSSLHVMHMLRRFGDEDDLLPDRNVGRISMALGLAWSRDTAMRKDALRRLDRAIAAEVRRTRDIRRVLDMDLDARRSCTTVQSREAGRIILPPAFGAARDAVQEVMQSTITAAIRGTADPLLPAPVVEGNGRLTRLLSLCHQALAQDPDLADAAGTPMRPLIEAHVPDLLARHQAAVETADPADIAAIDRDLEAGIEIVTGSMREALSRHADDRRRALSEQIAFLQYRHPRDLLGSMAADDQDMEKTGC
jgi:hypothetical protein